MICKLCGSEIPVERLEILPDTKICVKCAVDNPPPDKDPNLVCAQASVSNRNGFSPNE